MSEHTKEPWKVLRYHQSGARIGIFPADDDGLNLIAEIFGEANARRIVACVNACAGISTEWLEQQGRKLRIFDIRTLEDAFNREIPAAMVWAHSHTNATAEDIAGYCSGRLTEVLKK